MKYLLILILLFSFSFVAFGQDDPADSGFTDKSQAPNQLVKGLKEGKWVQYFKVNKGAEVETANENAPFYRLTFYKAGKPAGIMRQYYKSGKIESIIPFDNGKQNGIVKGYYENGKPFMETPFTEGKVLGVRKIFTEQGDTILLDTVMEDREYGVIKTYYKGGKIKMECPFINYRSNIMAKISFEPYGVIHVYHSLAFRNPVNNLNGIVDGILKFYYESGKLESETPFRGGEIDGVDKEYYEDGKIRSESPFRHDVEDGDENVYYENGKLKSKTIYDNGKKGITKNFDENGNFIK